MDENNLNESETKRHGRSVLSRIFIFAGCLAVFAGLCFLVIYLINENRHVVIEPFDIPQKKIITPEQGEEEMSISANLNSQYNKLLNHWGGDCPDYYGGAYIEDRSLHVLVTCDPEDIREEIVSVTGNPNIEIILVEYSYNELNELKDKMSEKMRELVAANDKRALYLSGFGVYDKENRIKVYLPEDDQDKADQIASLLGVRSDNRVRFVYAPVRVADE